MIPFMLKVPVLTPVLRTGGYLTLDGIIQDAYFRSTGRLLSDDEMPFAKEGEVFHASACFFPLQDLAYGNLTLYGRLQHDELRSLPERALPKRGGRYTYESASGEMKAPKGSFQTVNTPFVMWFCFGDPDKTLDLLGHVQGIGRKIGMGWGSVDHENVSITTLQEDASFVLHGNAARPIPVEMWQGRPQQRRYCAIRYPYWSSKQVECVVPTAKVLRFSQIPN
ncbi:hypothetical protein [Sulfuricystis multivorans]|uniref:hypothetical protein n=1 Tax=Sulfuricystis multivorans TaxID=2211108 RepID=UPI0011CFB22F|nr:hypothetical protein [Sulfuricystis multivorans]